MSFRNVVLITARRAIARAMIASATVASSTVYCESSTSCRSICICRCTGYPGSHIGNQGEEPTACGSIRRALDES